MSRSNGCRSQEIKICSVNRKIFQYSLLWPDDGTELNPGRNYIVKILCFFLCTGLMTALTTIHFLLAIINDEELNTEEIAVLIAAYGTYYMICAYIKNQRQVALLLRDLSQFENFGKPPGFEKKDKQLNLCVKMLVAYSFTGTVVYSSMKLFEKGKCKAFHLERKSNGNYCGLIAPFWLPFEIDYFPVFHLWLLYGFLAACLLLKMCLHISFNALEIAHHIILRIHHLRIMFLECFNSGSNQIIRVKLATCVLYHKEILELIMRLDDIFFNSMFGHFALTGTICACLEKQIVDGYNVYAGTVHFIGWILALFIGCVGGQHLLNANEVIPNALWISNWYTADVRIKRDFLFILTRSHKDFYIRAGPFGVLSYPLFVSVLKASYSILCLLSS
ncbi:hypothetical protein Zmor_026910 [Zophobas morio]|uniref:Odorant receptor n=1 Tax=Zophobas morio TaxID=2755281 RepID=A0AA38M6D8_9CUCU|nr:hypothetical protein Zmor_026910 [Zophobas morio]